MKTLNCGSLNPGLLTLAIAAAATPAVAETTNCTPITSVPYVITIQGVYCFTDNIATSISSGSAIEVLTNNVTIDLNGFKLGGLAAGLGTNAKGIYAYDRQNITIRNGIVRGFYQGILLDGFYVNSLGHLVEDVLADQNTYMGISVTGSGCVVRRNQVVATGGTTLNVNAYGIYSVGTGNDVLNNRVAGTVHTSNTFGIFVFIGKGSVVEGNRVSGDASGTTAYGIRIGTSPDVLVVGNRITSTDEGIFFASSSGKYMDNLTSGVTTPFTGGTAVGTNNN